MTRALAKRGKTDARHLMRYIKSKVMDPAAIAKAEHVSLATVMESIRSIEMYDYHVQAAAYREATGLPVVFLFAESDAPNDVTMIDDIAELAEIGERRWNRAKAIWKRCLETGDWPGAGGGRPVRVEASTYALSEDNEAAQNE